MICIEVFFERKEGSHYWSAEQYIEKSGLQELLENLPPARAIMHREWLNG